MATEKHSRDGKRQLGQFFTPPEIAEGMLSTHAFNKGMRVLEPGFGTGAFLFPLIERFLRIQDGDIAKVLTENVWGVEVDPSVYRSTVDRITQRWGALPPNHNLHCGDFLDPEYLALKRDLFCGGKRFDLIIGNPPFGGTVSLKHQDKLERQYGRRHGEKIKRETYSLFIVKSLDLLKDGGELAFICSDTFLTIPTMKGLRNALMREGTATVVRLDEFSPETSYPMVVLHFSKGAQTGFVSVEHTLTSYAQIRLTENLSWRVSSEYSRFFGKSLLRDVLVASSGMTTGRNEFFVREIDGGVIIEPFLFEFFDEPICLEREVARARLGRLAPNRVRQIQQLESAGATKRNVKVVLRDVPELIQLPHPDYRYYNKAQAGPFYSPPRYAIYWKDDGDAVRTFKKNGNWYLHGVGGAPYFEREGMTWRLIASRLDMRYLPQGYILDSGAPCAFLRPGVDKDELWFVLGWCNSQLCSDILKNVLNHTMNIQSKDVERLPYPWWVSADSKQKAIRCVNSIVSQLMRGSSPSAHELEMLRQLYEYEGHEEEFLN